MVVLHLVRDSRGASCASVLMLEVPHLAGPRDEWSSANMAQTEALAGIA